MYKFREKSIEIEDNNTHEEQSIDKEATGEDSPQVEMPKGIGDTTRDHHRRDPCQ